MVTTSENQGLDDPSVSSYDASNWQIETLLHKAFIRTKARFLSYFLTFIVSWGLFIGLIIGAVLIGLLIVGIVAVTKATLLLILLVPLVVTAVVGGFYLSSWTTLTLTQVMIQEVKQDIISVFKKTRPMVWGYVGVQAVIALVLIGLLPFILVSLGIVAVLWALWLTFVPFVYLQKQTKGTQTIWYSKNLFNQEFWKISGRISVVFAILFLIQIMLTTIRYEHSLQSLAVVLSMLISIFTGPFIVSYNYELFKNVKGRTVTPSRPIVWILLSVIGWILMIFVMISTASMLEKNVPSVIKQYNQQKNKEFLPPQLPSITNDRSSHEL